MRWPIEDEEIDKFQEVVNRAWDIINRKRIKQIPMKDLAVIQQLQDIAGKSLYHFRVGQEDNKNLKKAALVALSPHLTGEEDLDQYHQALYQEGPLAYTWSDKPHRLVLQLIKIAKKQREEIKELKSKYDAAVSKED
jgi:hypothetical protein